MTISANVSPGAFVYSAGAASFTVATGAGSLAFLGAGVQNSSGTTQNLVSAGPVGSFIQFQNASNVTNTGVGSKTSITVNSGDFLQFLNTSSATGAQIVGNGGYVALQSSAGTVTIGSLQGSGLVVASTDGGGAANQNLTVGGLNLNTTYSGRINPEAIGDSASISLTKVGTGTLTLTGANTYAGATKITAGTLALSGTNGSIASSSQVALATGGTFSIAGLTNGGTSVVGLADSAAGQAGAVVLGSNTLTITSPNAPPLFSGVISGTGGLNVTGGGGQALAGTSTYSGATTVSGFLNLSGSILDSTTINIGTNGRFLVQDAAGIAPTSKLTFTGGLATLSLAQATQVGRSTAAPRR